jgi:hypothetical protein
MASSQVSRIGAHASGCGNWVAIGFFSGQSVPGAMTDNGGG